MISDDALLHYYERTTCSPQWLEFNRAMAAELGAGLPPAELRALFFRIGERVAQTLPVARCDTLEELQAAFNARWEPIGWGLAALQDQGEHLQITHACSPLSIAFGEHAVADWAVGFLEGAYQAWFAAQGVPPTLSVRAVAPHPPTQRQVLLRLGKDHA